MEQLHEVEYGNSIIRFSLTFSKRKTLGISIYPDTNVKVVAPENATLQKVKQKVEKRGRWIQKQVRKFTEIHKPIKKLEYVSGETLYYAGRQYRLKIHEGRPGIKLAGKFFQLYINRKDDKKKAKQLLDDWYREHAHRKLHERFEKYRYIIQREKINFNSLIIMRMGKRWGSCTNKGNIVLNTNLVKVPVDCMDYVIIHEICHLKHLNHSSKFYNTLGKHLPDWEKKKRKLEQF